MDRKVVALAVLAAAGGVGLGLWRSPERKQSAAQEIFPPEKLKGAAENARIKVVNPGKQGGPLLALAFAPDGLEAGQVVPTAYVVLQNLRRQYPKAPSLAVFLSEDSAMADASNWAAVAQLRNDAITVTGGFPTAAQLDSLAKEGTPLARPTPADLKATAAVFDSTGSLAAERWGLSQSLLGPAGLVDRRRFFALEFETTSLHGAAKAMGRAPKELQATVLAVTRYYWLNAGKPLEAGR